MLASGRTWKRHGLRSSFCGMLFSVIERPQQHLPGILSCQERLLRARPGPARSTRPGRAAGAGTRTRGRASRASATARSAQARTSPSLGSTTTSSVGASVDARARSSRVDQRLRLRRRAASSRSTTASCPPATLAATPRAARRAASAAASPCRSSRGVGPKGLPPPFHWVARIEPCRARPVPFCFHGFLPPPDTSLRPLVSWVPARRSASSRTTAWWSSGSWIGAPKTSAASSSVPRAFPLASTTCDRRHAYFACPLAPSACCALVCFTLLRTTRSPPVAPGTAPRQQDRFCSGSTRTTARLQHRARAPRPCARAAGGPGHTREGSDDAPIEPGRPVEHRAVGGVAAGPAVALDAALEALPLVTPITSTSSPGVKRSDGRASARPGSPAIAVFCSRTSRRIRIGPDVRPS